MDEDLVNIVEIRPEAPQSSFLSRSTSSRSQVSHEGTKVGVSVACSIQLVEGMAAKGRRIAEICAQVEEDSRRLIKEFEADGRAEAQVREIEADQVRRTSQKSFDR
eukprot:gnl/TRDRNA2_/TRDRNA2_187719_c0_seq1.p1 gnl/TRDRNA2_/TRDRNA2_187719_c0~~gnl/TRDRNA2_/TRDRNA2_187719_c0_seq1.p1  ORF type:complete len:106 (+),score=12.26 gnl/TRDRNA2_/TRDRNA2_187719_c0_seq1:106-423(+)